MPTYKIAIVGDGAVGKSSLLKAKKSNTFDPEMNITIGVDFQLIPLESVEVDGKKSNFLAMDLGGQERFQFMHDSYIKGIKAAIILFDVSRIRTFFNIEKWYELILNENDKIPVLIVGNKIDLIDMEAREEIAKDLDELIEELPRNQNVFGPFFTSSKNFEGIIAVFAICEEMILEMLNKESEEMSHKKE